MNKTIPSIASGIFGYIGYDFVANIENLPKEKFDELNLPDGILLRPSITVVFDKKLEEVLICRSVWFDENVNAEKIYKEVYDQIISIK